jgi:hypothetical protein
MSANEESSMTDQIHCAQIFATRFSGAALAEQNLMDAVAAAHRVVSICARIATEQLPWDSVVAPFGSVMLRLSKRSDVMEGKQ